MKSAAGAKIQPARTKVFNTTGVCVPQFHYMANIENRVEQIKKLVDGGKYFTINRARQYGKTTTLLALSEVLRKDYYVVSLDFQTFDNDLFKDGKVFTKAFAQSFLREFRKNKRQMNEDVLHSLTYMRECAEEKHGLFTLKTLFEQLSDLCAELDCPLVLIIDEVDSAANNQVFLDFLAQIRAQYLRRFQTSTFQSVILAGVCDIKNLKLKFRPEQEHMYNSPWNIATDFKIDMSLSANDIAGMLAEYEEDHHTGMEVGDMAKCIYDYTDGYPFLVSRICQIMDEDVSQDDKYPTLQAVWTREGLLTAVRILLAEKNTLFESLIGKLHEFPELNEMLKTLLFTGKTYSYATDESSIDLATMFGFIKNQDGNVAIANRIFETRLYNYYLSENEMQTTGIYKASLQDKSQFIVS